MYWTREKLPCSCWIPKPFYHIGPFYCPRVNNIDNCYYIRVQIKVASVKLAVKYMKRVSAELEMVGGGPEEEELIVQGVKFAFRVHQVNDYSWIFLLSFFFSAFVCSHWLILIFFSSVCGWFWCGNDEGFRGAER